MMYAYDFRKIARDGLSRRWATAVGTGLVASLFGITYFNNRNIFEFIFNKGEEGNLIRISYGSFSEAIQSPFSGLIILALVWTIICIIVGGAITLGYARFNMNMVAKDRKTVYYSDLFSQFSRIGTGFLMQLLRWLFVFLWSLLLVIPGIIASYSYSMTAYIMLDHPEYSAYKAIMESKKMMRGNKGRLFCLHFSFIGWYFLSVLTWGIGLLWLNPYVEAATAAFYREISQSNSENYQNEYNEKDYFHDHNIQNDIR